MKDKHPDYILFGVVVILVVLGILILASVSAPLSQKKFGNTYYFLIHQIVYGLLPGLILAFLAFKIPLSFFKKWAPILLLINLILLGMVFLPKIGSTYGGATRWLNFGKITFQPSEFLKITFILYLASWLNSRVEKSTLLKKSSIFSFSQTFIAFFIILVVISLFLVLQPDISTLGIIVLVAILMYFLANTPLWHNILIIFLGAIGFFVLIKLASYRIARLLVFLKPETDPLGIGYQIKQALIAVGSGGIFGLGFGFSRQKFGFLPKSMSDTIFAIFSEETGFIGSLILISLFLIFLWLVFKISTKSQDKFSQLLSFGIGILIVVQALLNIGSMIGILPLLGSPLPFISYGGSHLIVELIGVGLLLNISKKTSR